MSEARVVSSAAEMLPLAELTGIKVFEIAGRRVERAEDEPAREPSESFSVLTRSGATWFETRSKMVVRTADADLVADAAAIFSYSEPLDVPQNVAGEFVEKVGLMAVYPFLREQVFTAASRLGVAPPVLGLLRAGGFTVGPATVDDATSESEPAPTEPTED